MKEVITLQFGHFSNFVGSHFWNIQDELYNLFGEKSEIDSNCLYRFGKTLNNVATVTPRLLIFDVNGSLGSLKQSGYLYSQETKVVKEQITSYWGGKVEVKQEETVKKTKFIETLEKNPENLSKEMTKEVLKDLDENTNYWSDYLLPHLHPKSISLLKEYSINDKFNVYTNGALLKNQTLYDQYLENLNFFVEECDSLQGFQIFVNTSDAWSKIAVDYIDMIKDEIGPKNVILTFGMDQEVIEKDNEEFVKDSIKRKMNLALSTADLFEKSNIFVPLSTTHLQNDSFEHLNYSMKPYQTSAIFASAIDTATLLFRRKQSKFDMRQMQTDMNTMPSTRISTLSTSMPFPLKKDNTFFDILSSLEPIHQSKILVPLTPGVTRNQKTCYPYSQSASLRGVTFTPLFPKIERFSEKFNDQNEYAQCKSHHDMFEIYTEKTKSYNHESNLYSQGSPCPLSYPDFFKKEVLEDGTFDGKHERISRLLLYPQLTYLQTTKEVKPLLDENLEVMKKFNYKGRHEYNFQYDDFEEYREKMYRIVDNYLK